MVGATSSELGLSACILHARSAEMRLIVMTDVLLSVCPCVCLSVGREHECCAKTTEPIEIPCGLWTRVGSRNHVLGAGPRIPSEKGQFLNGRSSDAAFRQNSLATCSCLQA